MRPHLLHPLGDRRHSRAHRGRSGARAAEHSPRGRDPAVQRVREAGGPVDQAFYACECGYLFNAAVSTTVMCPHCGVGQAW
jgi:hypothetical protein